MAERGRFESRRRGGRRRREGHRLAVRVGGEDVDRCRRAGLGGGCRPHLAGQVLQTDRVVVGEDDGPLDGTRKVCLMLFSYRVDKYNWYCC